MMIYSAQINFVLLCVFMLIENVYCDCAMFNYCNGHGICNGAVSKCDCFEGFGAASDITLYRAPDCSALTCPSGRAWGDVPTASDTAHALTECSNRGICDRSTGQCECFDAYTGDACQRLKCPNDCSGHGQCVSISQMARMENAFPLNNNTYYEGYQGSTTWDEDKVFGCVCDSSWAVGLGSGQRQKAEWFGPDCSLRESLPAVLCRSVLRCRVVSCSLLLLLFLLLLPYATLQLPLVCVVVRTYRLFALFLTPLPPLPPPLGGFFSFLVV